MGSQLSLFRPTKSATSTKTFGEGRLEWLLQHLQENPIEDDVKTGMSLQPFITVDNRVMLGYQGYHGHVDREVHSHAFGQLCSWLKLNRPYISGLLKEEAVWARELAERNLKVLAQQRRGTKNFLLRSVNNELRGVMSDAYKRFDSPQIIDIFAKACDDFGARPYNAFASDLRVFVQGALPQTYEAASSKVTVGAILKHSDFGMGALEVRFFLSVGGRSMVGSKKKGMWKIHRGRRISNDVVERAARVGEDSAEAGKTIRKLVQRHFNEENIKLAMTELDLASEKPIDPDDVSDILTNLSMDDTEVERTKEAFLDESSLPKGLTLYRLANAVSWLAGKTDNTDRKLTLMETAGDLILKAR